MRLKYPDMEKKFQPNVIETKDELYERKLMKLKETPKNVSTTSRTKRAMPLNPAQPQDKLINHQQEMIEYQQESSLPSPMTTPSEPCSPRNEADEEEVKTLVVSNDVNTMDTCQYPDLMMSTDEVLQTYGYPVFYAVDGMPNYPLVYLDIQTHETIVVYPPPPSNSSWY
ncbi:hypothetical protein SAMD00019534_005420 [Acytostelium subglobosum LB1]|uniref:hypothetical protein n=1 Tax=Acytostelium subglobosum LB1 TaxID=1410327 RepID=UPI0006451509|nr:hypothetical protein SAMD00019534_005420 [Acytostelium subglobosum LB1]GAM17367.1 hypothetical protein SAMD00019534_005420 [Acytostelium subglobosum LB1]|eukprot:XP_012759429.1 hypothetical protein SAMD00019534_005420 [Acytostelium subglobosum LB1]